ncbi:MAG: GTP-binding protein [Candidatus Asgardarchaeia archaeon]
MMIDWSEKRVFLKVVYYGPAMSGKTTSLKFIFKKLNLIDRLRSIETSSGRTLLFDFGNIEIPLSESWKVVVNALSATGQDYYIATRPTVLKGTDGVVFVADAQKSMLKHNIRSWNELSIMLEDYDRNIPIVVCLNKVDLEERVSKEEIRALLDIPNSIPIIETIAIDGKNVFEAFKTILRKIFRIKKVI